MSKYYSDIPSDSDLLGRFSFAKEIAHSLITKFKTGEDSIVIGINGKWGCGKSTLLKFIREEIKKETGEKQRILFEFNPWLFSGQKELQTIFLNQLLEKMHDLQKRVRRQVTRLSRLIEVLMYLTKILSKIRPLAKYINSGLGEMIADFEKFINAFDKDRPLDKIKMRVDDQIAKSGIMFFIFIDDIERLTPEETTEVFQLIKLNANFKNTIYIIAYDREIVQDSLMQQYKEVGRRYLDKIVQVDYKVPEIFSEVLEDIFFEKLQLFLEQNEINYDSKHFFKIWQHNDFKGFFNTLRDVYRYINALQLRLPAIHNEIAVADFLILEAVRLFDNYSYEEIYKAYRVSLIKKHSIQRVLNENNEFQTKSNPFARSLIRGLFSFDEEEGDTNTKIKKISNPRFFERYFSLSLSSADVVGDIYGEFIDSEDKRIDLLHQVFTGTKASYFIRRILNTPIGVTDERLNKIIIDIILFGSQYYDSISMAKYADQLFELIDNLSSKLQDKGNGYKMIFDELLLAKNVDNVFVAFIVGKYYEKINNLLRGDYLYDREIQMRELLTYWGNIDYEYYLRIEEAFQKSIEEMVKKRFIHNMVNKFFESFFILKYAEFFPNGHYNYLKKLVADRQKDKLIDLISYSLEFNQVSNRPVLVNIDNLLFIIPFEKIFKEIVSIIFYRREKNDHQNEILSFILKNMSVFEKAY